MEFVHLHVHLCARIRAYPMDHQDGASSYGGWKGCGPNRLDSLLVVLSRWRHGFESRWDCQRTTASVPAVWWQPDSATAPLVRVIPSFQPRCCMAHPEDGTDGRWSAPTPGSSHFWAVPAASPTRPLFRAQLVELLGVGFGRL